MTATEKKILGLLKQNARLSNAEISTMLGITEQEADAGIKALENEGIITPLSSTRKRRTTTQLPR